MPADDRWPRVRSLLEEVVERPRDQRPAFLARACPDADVRADVESLLRAYDEAGSFLEPSTGPSSSSGAPPETAEVLPPGTRLGHFELQAPLGTGGMGQVYSALDRRLGREVAIKLLSEPLAVKARSRGWLEHEARSISRLSHPHICVLYDVGRATGDDGAEREFLVMELVEGETLAARLAGGALPIDQALTYATQIAEALAAAHARGIVHGDVKPSNIVLSPTGVKLLDFGLARLRVSETREAGGAGRDGYSPLGPGAGTLPYMAPELLLGHDADERSDVHAFGVVLYEMLTGRRPYAAPTAPELMTTILDARPAPLREPPAVPEALVDVVLTCLAKDPALRWQQAHDLTLALRAVGGPAVAPAPRAPRRSGRAARALALVCVVGLALLGRQGHLGPGLFADRPAESDRVIQSVAVLPLENLARDPEQDYFADGMTEALGQHLSSLKSVRVISRRSTMQFKGANGRLSEIAKSLNADAIVTGSVQHERGRVRISTHLIRGDTGETLWASSFDRDTDDVLTLQTEIAHVIAGQIDRTIRGPVAPPAVNAVAYETYLKGLFELRRLTPDSTNTALAHFQHAVAQDPTFAAAHLGIGEAYTNLGSLMVSAQPAADVRPRAVAAVRRALELDPDLARAHSILAGLKEEEWHWAEAEDAYRRAVALEPSLAEAHAGLGWLLICRGRAAEAIASSRWARELDPLSAESGVMLGVTLHVARRYDEAVRELRNVVTQHPRHAGALAFLGLALLDAGEPAAAVQALEQAVSVSRRSPYYLGMLAGAYARADRRRDARQILTELEQIRKKRYVTPGAFVFAFSGLGDREGLLAAVERAHTERANLIKWLAVAPVFDPVRSEPRFVDLARKVGLE